MNAPERYWSTSHLQGAEALRYWEDVVCEDMIQCRIDSDVGATFAASLRSYELNAATFHFVQSSRADIRRTIQCISRKRNDGYFLLHQRQATILVEQHGRSAVLEAGDCALISGRSPFRICSRDTTDGVAMAIPTELLLGWIPEPDAVTAQTLGGRQGWGHALAATLSNFNRIPPTAFVLSPAIMLDQILAHLAIASNSGAAGTTRHQHALLRCLSDTLASRYYEPNFDPSSLAKQHGVSKRYVHMLFAKAGTSFGRELERIRLERAKRLLEDRRFIRIDIKEIGWRCGFCDSSAFAKRFRDRYGAPPSIYRKQVTA